MNKTKTTFLLLAGIFSSFLIQANFSSATEVISSPGLSYFMMIDMNNDGFEDIIAIKQNTNYTFHYFEHDGNGSYKSEVIITPPANYQHEDINSFGTSFRTSYPNGDLNNDGYPEIIFGNVVLSYSGTTFSFLSFTYPAHLEKFVEIFDLNQDNLMDLVATKNSSNLHIYLLENKGGLVFSIVDSVDLYSSGFGYTVVAFDIDNDNKDELFLDRTYTRDQCILYDIVGNKLIEFPNNTSLYWNEIYAVYDMNLDGINDVIYKGHHAETIAFLKGYATVEKLDTIRYNPINHLDDTTYNIIPFDFNNDCEVELIVGKRSRYCSGADSLLLLKKDGKGDWNIAQSIKIGIVNNCDLFKFQISGVKQTGKKDLLVLTATGIDLYENQYNFTPGACTPTNVKETKQSNEIAIFPNPSSGFINLSSSTVKNGTLNLYELSGRLIHSIEVSGNQAIDLSGITKGIYLPLLINQETGEKYHLKKLLVQ